jgi:hypothetical protein
MNSILQAILIVASIGFFIFILRMLKAKKLEFKYSIVWIIASFSFIVLSIFPKIVRYVANVLHIIEPVNAVYLIIIFFLLVIVFTLTVALSRNSNRVKALTQEIGILKLEIRKNENNKE